jgi:acetyl-CoA synthetase
MTKKIISFEDYQKTYDHSVADPEGFWAEQANSFQWKKPWKKNAEMEFPRTKSQLVCGRKAQYHRKRAGSAP